MTRVIRKSAAQSAAEALDLLGALFSAELVRPSKCLWLVSPWISDVEIIDNTAGTYPALARYGRRPARLAEVLGTLAGPSTRIVIGTTSDQHNRAFLRRLDLLASDRGVAEFIDVHQDATRALHTKALTGDDYALVGSMNITYNGINLRDEYVQLETDEQYVARARMDVHGQFGGIL